MHIVITSITQLPPPINLMCSLLKFDSLFVYTHELLKTYPRIYLFVFLNCRKTKFITLNVHAYNEARQRAVRVLYVCVLAKVGTQYINSVHNTEYQHASVAHWCRRKDGKWRIFPLHEREIDGNGNSTGLS